MKGQSAKISRSNFRRWTFQNCSTHNIHLALPLTTCTLQFEPRFKPAEKLVKNQRAMSSSTRVAYNRGYGPWLSCVQGSLVCCCWKRAILHERSGELSQSVCCSSCKIGSNRQSRHKLGSIVRHLEIADIPVKEAQQQRTGVK